MFETPAVTISPLAREVEDSSFGTARQPGIAAGFLFGPAPECGPERRSVGGDAAGHRRVNRNPAEARADPVPVRRLAGCLPGRAKQ